MLISHSAEKQLLFGFLAGFRLDSAVAIMPISWMPPSAHPKIVSSLFYSTQLLITASNDLKHQESLGLGLREVGLGFVLGYGIGGSFTRMGLLDTNKSTQTK